MQRMTRQRQAITELLAETEDFRTAQQLHDELKSRGDSTGLATVYRTLQSLASSKDVDVLRTEEGEMLFRWCGQEDHHHHLVCRQCGSTVEIDLPSVESWANEVAKKHGFQNIEHTIEIFGDCASCSAK